MRNTKTKADLTKRGRQTIPAKMNPKAPTTKRLPGDSTKAIQATGKNRPHHPAQAIATAEMFSAHPKTPNQSAPPGRPSPRKKAASPSIFPTVGKMEGLIAEAKQLRATVNRREKNIRQEQKYLTADKWRYGQILAEIKSCCKRKGEWKNALKAIGETYQRADENIKIACYFKTEKDAGKVLVRRALKLIRKNRNPEDDDFVTPDWLFQRLHKRYDFTLDAAATKQNTKCRIYITAETDALKQDWRKWSKGGAVFCNPSFLIAKDFVTKAWQEAQKGIVVVMIVPLYQSQDWFKDYVLTYGEVRFIGKKATYQGGGSREGVAAGMGTGGANSMETLVIVFRKDQKAFLGDVVVKSYREEERHPEL